MKDKKNERNEEISFLLRDTYYMVGKHFYRLSKWLPLISLLMNINESHK